jgi:hypothetical protein
MRCFLCFTCIDAVSRCRWGLCHIRMSSSSLRFAIATSIFLASLTAPQAEAKRFLRGSLAEAVSDVGHKTGISQAVNTAAQQTETNISHGVEKVKTETTNFGENTEEAVRESGRFVRRQAHVIEVAAEAAGDGDLLTAGYRFQRDLINGSIDNSVKALQNSSMLRVGATVIASTYGGPAAVGALNGVLVYKTTGDSSQAWKTGLVSAGSSWATGQLSGYHAVTAGDIAASAVANGTVAGAATGVLGGDFEEGFERGAAGSLANTYFQHITGDAPDSRIPGGAAYPKDASSFDTTEDALRMMDQIPRNRPWTGMETFNLDAPQTLAEAWKTKPWGVTEDSGLMMSLAKIPVINPGSVLHDYLAMQNGWNFPELQLTIPPAFVVAGVAMHVPEQDLLFDTAVQNAKQDEKK